MPSCLSRCTTATISFTVSPNLELSPDVLPQCPLCLVLILARKPRIGRTPSLLLQLITSSNSSICSKTSTAWMPSRCARRTLFTYAESGVSKDRGMPCIHYRSAAFRLYCPAWPWLSATLALTQPPDQTRIQQSAPPYDVHGYI
jgi:hypothetical protein